MFRLREEIQRKRLVRVSAEETKSDPHATATTRPKARAQGMSSVCRCEDVALTGAVRSTRKKAGECSYNASEHPLDAALAVVDGEDAAKPRKKRKIAQTRQHASDEASDAQMGGRNDESVVEIVESGKS